MGTGSPFGKAEDFCAWMVVTLVPRSECIYTTELHAEKQLTGQIL